MKKSAAGGNPAALKFFKGELEHNFIAIVNRMNAIPELAVQRVYAVEFVQRVYVVEKYLLGLAALEVRFNTASLLHDVGKTKELSSFPMNDYTDEGQLLGHIIIGAQMVHDLAKEIPDFPETLENQLVHCILAHHGELEYGSPKKPALAEAVALNLADNTDARMETLTEIFASDKGKKEWLGYNRLFESNLRRTGDV